MDQSADAAQRWPTNWKNKSFGHNRQHFKLWVNCAIKKNKQASVDSSNIHQNQNTNKHTAVSLIFRVYWQEKYCWNDQVSFEDFHYINAGLGVVNVSLSLTKRLPESKWSPLHTTGGFMIDFKALAYKPVTLRLSSIFTFMKYRQVDVHQENAT